MSAPNTLDIPALSALLAREFPEIPKLLTYDSAFQLLISVILTANTTDKQVNLVTPQLFAQYPDAQSMARCPAPRILQELIRSVGLAPQKARHIHDTARILHQQHAGVVPLDFDTLLGLPGVGRKTAHVVLCYLAGIPGVIVDTHYARVARRVGLSASHTPKAIEYDTMQIVPKEQWCSFSQRINLLGRKWCVARKPKCPSCPIRAHCQFFLSAQI